MKLNKFTNVNSNIIFNLVKKYGTPFYLYDENFIIKKCQFLKRIPNAYGINIRYAMKANPNKTILKIINKEGIMIDASSLNEVRRAKMAGISYKNIILTTQEVYAKKDYKDLIRYIKKGLKYNVCSLNQLYLIGDFASKNQVKLSLRIHPSIGSGESLSRDTGTDSSCFGVHIKELDKVISYTKEKHLIFNQIHIHIGSGSEYKIWKKIVDLELNLIKKHFKNVEIVSFGGGMKEARMPDELSCNMISLGNYAKEKVIDFYKKYKKKLTMEIEPGTFIMANSCYAVTNVIDKKRNDMHNFVILNGGIDINARPLLYGSRHPFYILRDEKLFFSEFLTKDKDYPAIVVGTCCESGDSQCLTKEELNIPRLIKEPNINDIFIIGGVGAYSTSMSFYNYNSHLQAMEILLKNNKIKIIRKKQTLRQIVINEK